MQEILPRKVHLANLIFVSSFDAQDVLVYVFHIWSVSCSAAFFLEVIFKQLYIRVPNFGWQGLKTILVADKMAPVL